MLIPTLIDIATLKQQMQVQILHQVQYYSICVVSYIVYLFNNISTIIYSSSISDA